MNYIRIDHKGNMQPIRDELLVESISKEKGIVLIVTGGHDRSFLLYENLKEAIQPSEYDQRGLCIKKEEVLIRLSTSFDWSYYMAFQLSSAYVHRDASIDFLLKIMSKCRFEPHRYRN